MPKSEPHAFSGLPEFRAQIEAAGWRIHRKNMPASYNACDWYAVSPDRSGIAPDCDGNHKPPSLMLFPCSMYVGSTESNSVTIDIVGEAGGNWLKLMAYAMGPSEFFERWPLVRRQLIAAWAAAASIKD